MYICVEKNKEFLFVKSQTFKPTLLTCVNNYLIENSDINRNPFTRPTLIDLDKEFHVSRVVEISRASLCRRRKDVSTELFQDIRGKITSPNHQEVDIQQLLYLNQEYLKIKD
jgi:hypothetical protein